MKTLILFLAALPAFAVGPVAYRVDPPPAMTTSGTTPVGGFPALYAVAGANVYLYTDATLATLATTYTDTTGAVPCPSYAQVVLIGPVCVATTSVTGNFGWWLMPGNYFYTVSYGGKTYGPYPITTSTPGTGNVVGNGTAGDLAMWATSTTLTNANVAAVTNLFCTGGTANQYLSAIGTCVVVLPPTEVVPNCVPAGDTTACLQAWLNAPGSRFYLPPGIWSTSQVLISSASNVEIYGAGQGASIIQPIAGAQLPPPSFKDSEVLDTNGNNLYIHNLTIDVNNEGTNLSQATGIPAWTNTGVYWASGVPKNVGGGGNDTVLYSPGSSSSVCSIGNPCNVYKALQNPVAPGTVPANDGVHYVQIQTGITVNGNGLGIGIRGNHIKLQNIEIENGQLGIYMYVGSGDIELSDSNIHDMGDNMAYWGNNDTIFAIGGTANSVNIHHNQFTSMYAGTLGPGATVSACVGTTNLIYSNNIVLNVINNGGGSSTGGCGVEGASWTVSNNDISRTIAGINEDLTNCIEIEADNASITGNSCRGFDSGISITGLIPASQYDVVTGNTIQGDSCAIMDPSLINTYCYGVFLFNGSINTGHNVNYSLVEGNNISNENYGIINSAINVGNHIGTNKLYNNAYNIQDLSGSAIVLPPNQTTTIFADSTLNVFTGSTVYFSTKSIPALTNGTSSLAIIPGTIYRVHAMVFIQNTSGSNNYYLTPQVYFGHTGSVVSYPPIATIFVPENTTLGWLDMTVECNVQVVATSGAVTCSGSGTFDSGLNGTPPFQTTTGSNPVPINAPQALIWAKPVSPVVTNAWTSSDTFGLNFFTSATNTTLTVRVYDAHYEVIYPHTTL